MSSPRGPHHADLFRTFNPADFRQTPFSGPISFRPIFQADDGHHASGLQEDRDGDVIPPPGWFELSPILVIFENVQ